MDIPQNVFYSRRFPGLLREEEPISEERMSSLKYIGPYSRVACISLVYRRRALHLQFSSGQLGARWKHSAMSGDICGCCSWWRLSICYWHPVYGGAEVVMWVGMALNLVKGPGQQLYSTKNELLPNGHIAKVEKTHTICLKTGMICIIKPSVKFSLTISQLVLYEEALRDLYWVPTILIHREHEK
jgi:hypothetical protein